MCNLYNITTSQEAIRQLSVALRDLFGNLPPSYDVYPDYPAPIVRVGSDGEREIARARWGMPTPPNYLKGTVDRGVTNIRNVKSPHWRRWLGPEFRCVVPVTAFAEPSPVRDPETGRKPNVWFALDETRPQFWFAGIWTPWTGTRKKAEGAMEHELFAFLTCDTNEVVRPIHPKAMPVILTRAEEVDRWLTAPAAEALELQRPLGDASLQVVPRPPKEDEAA